MLAQPRTRRQLQRLNQAMDPDRAAAAALARADRPVLPWQPDHWTMRRRLRVEGPPEGVPELELVCEGEGCAGKLRVRTPPEEPKVSVPRVRQDLLDMLPEGAELLENGRVWVRPEGGSPAKVDDVWAVKRALNPFAPGGEDREFSPVQLAVNFPALFHYEASEGEGGRYGPDRRYGPAEEIVEDLYQRGVRIVRHPGLAQLMLGELLSVNRTVPVPADEIVDADSVRALVRASARLTNLLELAGYLKAREMKVFVTALTLGGGSSVAPRVREGYDLEGERGTLSDSPLVEWDGAWIGKSLVDDLTLVPNDFRTGDNEWDLQTFDPGNPCKRLVYRWVCRAIGEWLVENQDVLQPVLAGIEIGNEVDVRHLFQGRSDASPRCVPEHWGRLYAECAMEIRAAGCNWVPLWLPGLATYIDDGSDASDRGAMTFSGKVNFVRDMLRFIQVGLSTFESTLEIVDIVEGVDVHWYHTTSADARRAFLIPLELAAIRGAFADVLGRADGIELTLIESGINTICGEEETDCTYNDAEDLAHLAHLRPPVYTTEVCYSSSPVTGLEIEWKYLTDPLTGESKPFLLGTPTTHTTYVLEPATYSALERASAAALDWQANNLVTQFFLALAGGVRRFGPHGMVAAEPAPDGSSPFAGYGYRRDIRVKSASEAKIRPSGVALQRLAGLLGGREVDARLVWPVRDARDREIDVLDDPRLDVGTQLAGGSWPASNLVTVVEVTVWDRSSGGPERWGDVDPTVDHYLYLLFIDGVVGANEPTDTDRTPTAADITLLFDTSILLAWTVPLVPSGVFEAPGGGPDQFSMVMPSYADYEPLTASGTGPFRSLRLRVHRGKAPVLIETSRPVFNVSVALIEPKPAGCS